MMDGTELILELKPLEDVAIISGNIGSFTRLGINMARANCLQKAFFCMAFHCLFDAHTYIPMKLQDLAPF